MENQIYRIRMSDEHLLEFYVCDTNELKPNRDIKELGVVLYKDGIQIDGGLNETELGSLIKFLEDCERHVVSFNKTSIPEI